MKTFSSYVYLHRFSFPSSQTHIASLILCVLVHVCLRECMMTEWVREMLRGSHNDRTGNRVKNKSVSGSRIALCVTAELTHTETHTVNSTDLWLSIMFGNNAYVNEKRHYLEWKSVKVCDISWSDGETERWRDAMFYLCNDPSLRVRLCSVLIDLPFFHPVYVARKQKERWRNT